MLSAPKIVIKKRAILRKFGDDDLIDLKEAIVIEDNVIIERWNKGDSCPPPED